MNINKLKELVEKAQLILKTDPKAQLKLKQEIADHINNCFECKNRMQHIGTKPRLKQKIYSEIVQCWAERKKKGF